MRCRERSSREKRSFSIGQRPGMDFGHGLLAARRGSASPPEAASVTPEEPRLLRGVSLLPRCSPSGPRPFASWMTPSTDRRATAGSLPSGAFRRRLLAALPRDRRLERLGGLRRGGQALRPFHPPPPVDIPPSSLAPSPCLLALDCHEDKAGAAQIIGVEGLSCGGLRLQPKKPRMERLLRRPASGVALDGFRQGRRMAIISIREYLDLPI